MINKFCHLYTYIYLGYIQMGNALLDENKRDDPKEIYEQWL
jgi:hypothetical protein